MLSPQVYVKIVFIGDGAVGKTSIIKAFIGREFEHEYIMTLGMDMFRKAQKIKVDEDTIIEFIWHIWDIAGQPHWKEVRPSFYKGARGAILVYDVANTESYENIIAWVKEFIAVAGVQPMILVGNKIDLRENIYDCLTYEEGVNKAKEISEEIGLTVPYIESSALKKINIELIFEKIGQLIFEYASKRARR